jgi:3-oxoacyl-[acyl-carrier-protein] synthase III
MTDNMRGAAAIVGIGELKPERTRPGRDAMSLLAEAAYLAIQDAGLTKADIDGMILEEGMTPTGSGPQHEDGRIHGHLSNLRHRL